MSDHNRGGGDRRKGVTRRLFLQGVGTAGIGTLALPKLLGAEESAAGEAAAAESGGAEVLSGAQRITLRINGADKALTVEPRTTLLDAIREGAGLTGSKAVCDRGTCGACTVFLDGTPVTSCLVLAVDAVGREITTIEGLGAPEQLHAVQAAFVECDGLQCGFCTPGFVMSTYAVLKANPNATLDEIKAGLAGNICRCGTYTQVFKAALTAKASLLAAAGRPREAELARAEARALPSLKEVTV